MLNQAVRFARMVLNRAWWVIVLMVFVHLAAGLVFSAVEDKSLWDGQWWASVTGFTVGYGDLFPVTTVGRVVAQVYMFVYGILWLVLAAHVLGAVLEEKHLFSNEEQERMEAVLLEMSQQAGVVPEEFNELPPVEWFAENKGFRPSDT